MNRRLELQAIFEEILGSKNVYYEPPENVKMSYPAIVYHLNKIDTKKADNRNYMLNKSYTVKVIDRLPDNGAVNKILEMPYSSYDRRYKSDGLFHDVLTVYYY